jgi:hypothetical protein
MGAITNLEELNLKTLQFQNRQEDEVLLIRDPVPFFYPWIRD